MGNWYPYRYKYYFIVCPTNHCYDVEVYADDMADAVDKVMLQENVDIEYIQFVKYEEA